MTYSEKNKERFLNELIDFLSIPSISTDDKHKPDIQQAAVFVKNALKRAGADHIEIIQTAKHPIVYAEAVTDATLPTILVYGHYDVQPADPLDLWESEPFDPMIRNGRIYARGASDDKGQVYSHIKALEILNKEGAAYNIKFMIEGEEEIGSPNLFDFVRDHAETLAADTVLISDTSFVSPHNPSIPVGVRGLSYIEVEVTGPNRDLHSGIYGGAIANPANVLARMIAALHDERGRVTIPGFYDQVRNLPQAERGAINRRPFDAPAYKKDLGIKEVYGEAGYTTLERIGIRPSLDVNGIWGGYMGPGAKTVLPAKATAKISMRLVPDQDHEEISRAITAYLKDLAPHSVKIKVKMEHGAPPAVVSIHTDGFLAAEKAVEAVWGKKPIPAYEGGTLPIVSLMKEAITEDIVMLGFGLDSDRIHSPNESYRIDHYYKGIETLVAYHKARAAQKKS